MNEQKSELIDMVDKLIARRAELYQEYERIGLVLAEIAEKATRYQTPTAPPPKPRKRRSKGLPPKPDEVSG